MMHKERLLSLETRVDAWVDDQIRARQRIKDLELAVKELQQQQATEMRSDVQELKLKAQEKPLLQQFFEDLKLRPKESRNDPWLRGWASRLSSDGFERGRRYEQPQREEER